MRKLRSRVVAGTIGLLGAMLLGELGYRFVRGREAPGGMFFRDDEGVSLGPGPATYEEQVRFRSRFQTPIPANNAPAWFGVGYAMPRNTPLKNLTWLPNSGFCLCYEGPRQPYFDAHGCVEFRFNAFGIRDRSDLTLARPPGTQRIVCLGDSFTLGWGVRQEGNWPVLVERALQVRSHDVQVLNCGGSGSSYADEYELALRHRFGRFEPTLVLVTLCLNDLLLTNGKLCHYRLDALREEDIPVSERPWWAHSRILADLRRAATQSTALELDPTRDWVDYLMHLPADHLWYGQKEESPDVYWVGGAPQRALRGISAWCREHGARAAVVIWPLLQGLDHGEFYPFAQMHELVLEFCAENQLDCLDLLPRLRGHRTADLWVSPFDMHPNEKAQQLAAPAIAEFLERQLPR